MSFVTAIIGPAERVPPPDVVVCVAIQRLCSLRPIAEHADAANTQHYQLPSAFFASVLSLKRKYSSCFKKTTATTLQAAEEDAPSQTVAHADLADGQSMLERGCGGFAVALDGAAVPPCRGDGGLELALAARLLKAAARRRV